MTDDELRDGDLPFPREVWVGRPNDMDHGSVPCLLSKFATVPRWEGDAERDRDFQRYVDRDICDSAEKYYKHQIAALRAEVEKLREALFAAADTANKYAVVPTFSESILRAGHKAIRDAARAALKQEGGK